MAYPRRLSGTQLAPPRGIHTYTTSGSEEDSDIPRPTTSASLSPPRPFFFAADSTNTNRSSSSSLENTSLDPASDSDADAPNPAPNVIAPRAVHRVHARKRSSMSSAAYTALDTTPTPIPTATPAPTVISHGEHTTPTRHSTSSTHRATGTGTSNPPDSPTTSALFTKPLPHRPPPSSFAFPFQAYPGNPDPGLSIPGLSRRRSSFDSMNGNGNGTPDDPALPRSGSLSDLRKPFAPFMADAPGGGSSDNNSSSSLPRSSSSNSLYKQSAAANLSGVNTNPNPNPAIPRNSSVHSFRAPFLAPSSRPTSSLWSPPSYAHQYVASSPNPNTYTHTFTPASPTASTTALAPSNYPPTAFPLSKSKPPLPSTRLTSPLPPTSKPWLATRDPRTTLSYIITLTLIFLGIIGAALLCFTGLTSVNAPIPQSSLCMVMDEEFNGGGLDTDGTWNYDIELGGFGNGEFEMTTNDPDNIYISNGELFIMPTLTSNKVADILDGGKFTLDGCTAGSKTSSGDNGLIGNKANGNTNASSACSVTANKDLGTVINPVQSARINTLGKKSIRYGKVEVRAKLPSGDWLWPAIWMLPLPPSPYGSWPTSGEIDILEARGNPPSYPAQGSNFIRSSLNFGPFPSTSTLLHTVFGWFGLKRSAFSDAWHVYSMEWTEEFIRFSVDRVTHTILETSTRAHSPTFSFAPQSSSAHSYWTQAHFPLTAHNGSSGSSDNVVAVTNPYEGVEGATPAAPFDREFYMVVDLAVGGTSGWFPDGEGGKMWLDGSATAMRDFARAQDTWSKTWPANANDRAFRIDYIKMWELCK